MTLMSVEMPTRDKFSLKWNDFQENVNTAFQSLREDTHFSDVTLACEDGQQFEAHKVILATTSPLFRNLLTNQNHPHPLIYMRGMNSDDLNAVMDFLYYGEAKIDQENLANFLHIAEELKLKGLEKNTKQEQPDFTKPLEDNFKTTKIEPFFLESAHSFSEQIAFDTSIPSDKVLQEGVIAISNPSPSGDFEELDTRIKTMIIQGQTMRKDGKLKNSACTVCGKEGPYRNIKDHIEAIHVEDVCIPCNSCEKTFRSRRSLASHKPSHY